MPRSLIESGLRIVSVATPPESWDYLNENHEGRGSAFERPAWVSLFDEGALQFASPSGIRVQGGVDSDILGWGEGGQLQSLIVANDLRIYQDSVRWRALSPLAYDIARRLNVPAARTKPTLLLVNGSNLGLFFLTEPFDDEFLRSRFSHTDFAIYELRARNDDRAAMDLYGRMHLRARQVSRSARRPRWSPCATSCPG